MRVAGGQLATLCATCGASFKSTGAFRSGFSGCILRQPVAGYDMIQCRYGGDFRTASLTVPNMSGGSAMSEHNHNSVCLVEEGAPEFRSCMAGDPLASPQGFLLSYPPGEYVQRHTAGVL